MRRLPRALLTLLAVLTLCACGDKAQDGSNGEDAAVAWDELSFDETMPLDYAMQFSVSYSGDDYKRITIGQDQEFLLVAEGAAVPSGVPEGVTILQQPLDEIYLVASAAMDSFAQLDDLRTARLLAYLRQRDEAGTQVLLFSCHSRERAILEKAGIACHTLQLKTPQRRAANEREGNQNGNPTDRGTDSAADQDGGGAGR